jgi:hypothetical protein
MLLPYHRFVVRSRLSPQEVVRAMFAQTSRSDARSFQGEVDADGFKAWPAEDFIRNSFRPLVIGRIHPDPQDSRTS